ncbi:hypothetical protein BASA81_012838 [Batrachochytrium salamandrivorans]|nr:hypothetical protein BASA81_012838 [Batrachochytrium salamandrivorans]
MTRSNARLRVRLPGGAGFLTPYRRSHVPKYYSWMQDAQLREQTGSEEQTLEEEALNQLQWRDDPDKCTFIVTDLQNNPVGDVNLFFSKLDEDDGEDGGKLKAEINVMIAEKSARGKGLGSLAVWGMVWFAQQHFPQVERFEAKISLDNQPSLSMFTKRLGFVEESRSQAFSEATLVASQEQLAEQTASMKFALEPWLDEETEPLRLRGNLAFENRDFVQAIRFYDEAIKLDRMDEVLRGNRSAARLRSGELFGALSDALVCATLAPNYVKAYHRLGNAWAALGFESKAKDTYRLATKEFPEHQATFDLLATKAASEFRSQVLMTPITEEEFKLAPVGVEMEIEIEIKSSDPRGMRFGCILYIWKQLLGAERMGVYQECIRAGYAQPDEVTTPEQLELAKVPDWPEAVKDGDLPPKFVRYVSQLQPGIPRVASLVLMFEGCSFEEREQVGKMLLKVLLVE